MADKKILFLCAHNQSRSTTAEGLLKGEKGYQVKSRALWRNMPRKVTKEDGQWADEVYVMMPGMKPVAVEAGVPAHKLRALWIPDTYMACEMSLLQELKRQLAENGIRVKKDLGKAQKDCEDVMVRKGIYSTMATYWFGGEGDYQPFWHIQEGQKRLTEYKESEEAEVKELEERLKKWDEIYLPQAKEAQARQDAELKRARKLFGELEKR
jgi:predicted protein tyrosine phosphatase